MTSGVVHEPLKIRQFFAFADPSLENSAVAKKSSPTTANWDEAIKRFLFFRRLEKPYALPRAKWLSQVLTKEAQAIYTIADNLERTGKLVADLAEHDKNKIAGRITLEGWAYEVEHYFVPLDFLDDLPERLDASPPDLRRCAHALMNGADRAKDLVELYLECIARLRASRPSGRFPSVSMYWLRQQAVEEWGETTSEIARQLLRRKILPESKSSDPNLQRQWEMLLKKGFMRARMRTMD